MRKRLMMIMRRLMLMMMMSNNLIAGEMDGKASTRVTQVEAKVLKRDQNQI